MKRPHITWRRRPMTTLGLIFALLVVAVPAGRAADLVRERIVHTTFRPANTDLDLLETPGQAPRRLAAHPALDYNPVFSPDGHWLVFSSQRGGLNDEEALLSVFNPQPYGELYALRLADGLTVRLTHNKWEDGTPTWVALPR
jgi:hypothetical protein